MRKYHSKVDRNHPEIVDALRKAGATVQSLHTIGHGCPDIVVGFQGRNILMEIKDGLRRPSERALNAEELKWHEFWHGQVVTVDSKEAAIAALKEATA